MPTSLVSTGVQFPDNSIQTTAATAAPVPGATAVGGTILIPYGNYATLGYAANVANSITNNWTFLPPFPFSSGGTITLNNGTNYVPIYSSYYQGWLTILNINNDSSTAQSWICLSRNGGISYAPIMRAISSTFNPGSFTYTIGNLYNRQAPIAVDDSNGRIFCVWTDEVSNYLGVAYQTTIGNQNSTWTNSGIISSSAYGQTPRINAFAYVNMGGVTGNSGIVANFKPYETGNQISVIAAGGTSYTNRFSSGSPTGSNYGGNMVWNYSGLKAFAITPNGQGGASVSTNVNQSWTAMTNLSNTPGSDFTGGMAMSSAYNVYPVSSRTQLNYSTTFGSWTTTSPGLGTISGLTHNGTYWILRTAQGVFYSSSATPTGWTATGFLPVGSNSESFPIALRQY